MQYHKIPRKIIAEQYMCSTEKNLIDYKFFCFNGEPKFLYVSSDYKGKLAVDFYDLEWNHMDEIIPFDCYINAPIKNDKPKTFDKMLCCAKILASDFPFVRCDFYEINGECYFSELTFTPHGGGGKYNPIKTDYEWGEMLKLPI